MPAPSGRRYLALRTGVAAAAAVSGGTFARGLLPRSTSDQAMATGVAAAFGMGVGTLAVSAVEATAELVAQARGRGNPETTTLIAACLLGFGGRAASHLLSKGPDAPLPLAAASSAAWALGSGSLVAAAVVASDRATRPRTGRTGPVVGIAIAAALGGASAALRVRSMERRAESLGEDRSAYHAHVPASKRGLATSVALGTAVGGGLLLLAGAEFALAEGSTALVSRAIGRADDPVTPLVGHSIAAAGLVPAGGYALRWVRRRMMHADDVVEPAYPTPPTSPFVTAGPFSLISFEDIGKEGRRFVLMALTAQEISEVMGEPALDPVRAVAGYASAATPAARAELALAELEALGAYDRSVIVVAAPTGVGYVNYSFAEAVELLARGDCAIVVPQYALVPSALALNRTDAGVEMQTLILAGIRDRLAAMPGANRPRLLQFGESLGAQVALDVAAAGTHRFEDLGLDGGLYLGTPFRTALWDAWCADPAGVDPAGVLAAVPSADEIPGQAPSVRHVQVIHHDDPINKFAYETVVRTPWWMGEPQTRPPLVPKETEFRPVTTFILNLVDLKNGMNSQPGVFTSRGHDYRKDLCDAIRYAYHMPASDEQVARIERTLREREQAWAARRMVAKRFESARASVLGQLSKWGVDPEQVGLDQQSAAHLARGDISGLLSRLGSSGPSGA